MGYLFNNPHYVKLLPMKKLLLLISILTFSHAQAWNHGILLGFGKSRDIERTDKYYDYGFLLNAKLYKFKKIDKTLIFTIDGFLGHLRTTTKDYNNLYTAAISGAFRAYFATPEQHKVRPYMNISFGPAYISSKQYGEEKQGTHFVFQTTMGGGVEFTKNEKGLDLSLQLAHYCNAGLAKPNEGYDVFYIFSIGYLF